MAAHSASAYHAAPSGASATREPAPAAACKAAERLRRYTHHENSAHSWLGAGSVGCQRGLGREFDEHYRLARVGDFCLSGRQCYHASVEQSDGDAAHWHTEFDGNGGAGILRPRLADSDAGLRVFAFGANPHCEPDRPATRELSRYD